MVLSRRSALALVLLLTLALSGQGAAVAGSDPAAPNDPAPVRGEYVRAAAYSRDGSLLALTQCKPIDGKGEPRIMVFNTRTWEPLFELTGPSDTCTGVAFSADGARVYAACADGLVYTWDTTSRGPGQKLNASAGPCESVVLSPDGKTLVTGHRDSRTEPARTSIHVWDAATGKPLRAITPDVLVSTSTLTFTPDGNHIAGGAVDPRIGADFSGVIEWDLASGDESRRYAEARVAPGAQAVAHAVAYTRDGKWLIVGGGETAPDPAQPNASKLLGRVCLIDRATGKLVKTLFENRPDHVRLLLLSPSEDRLYVCTRSLPMEVADQGSPALRTLDELQCWNTTNWELMWRNESELATDWALIGAPDGQRIATSSNIGFYFFDGFTGDPRGGLIYSRRD